MTTPYTYLIGWTKQDVFYIGVRYAKGCCPSDLWASYYTSSQYVTGFRYLHGEPDVIVTSPVDDKEMALAQEEVLHFYFDAVGSDRYLNRNQGGRKFKRPPGGTPRPGNKGREIGDEGKAKLKAAHNTEGARANHSKANSRPYTDEMREKAAITRAKRKAEGWVNPRKGTTMSDEDRAKLKLANSKPETKARRSEAMRKRHAERVAREAEISSAAACDAPSQYGC